MEEYLVKVGIIGPTNIPNLSQCIGMHEQVILEVLEEIGKTLADLNCEVWVNSDRGTLVEIAKAYKKHGGKKLVVLYPKKGEPWPKGHAEPYKEGADEIREEKNWFMCNYNVISLPDVCVCVGLSPGAFSELAYINWDQRLKCGNIKRLVGIRDLLRDGKFPIEFETELKDFIFYTNSWGLKDFLKELKKEVLFERQCKEFQEIGLFYFIRELGGFIWHLNHDMADGRIPEEEHGAIDADIAKMNKQLMFAAEQLKRFSVKKSFIDGKMTKEYRAWYDWWDKYEKSLSEEDFISIEQALARKEDVGKWRPKGHWKEKIKTKSKKSA